MPGILGCFGKVQNFFGSLYRKMIHTEYQKLVFERNRNNIALYQVCIPHFFPKVVQSSEQQDCIVLVDGEIYKCHNRVNPDFVRSSEFLADLYRNDKSLSFLNGINGVFSAVIYDKIKNRSVLITDPLGLKFVYYFSDDEKFVFSSELKVFSSIYDIKNDIDVEALDDFMHNGYLNSNRTWLNKVNLLEPGNYIDIDLNDLTYHSSQYYQWNLEEIEYKNFNDAKCIIKESLSESFSLLTSTTARYGIELSGGYDSRLLLAQAEQADLDIITYTLGDDFSEDLVYARGLCRINNTINYSKSILEKDWFMKRLQLIWLSEGIDLIHLQEEPTLSRMANDGISINLNGFLGDAVFGPSYLSGYKDTRFERIMNRGRRFNNVGVTTWNNFVCNRLPFVEIDFLKKCLAADLAYVNSYKIYAQICRDLQPSYFKDIPKRGTNGETVENIIDNLASKPRNHLLSSCHDYQEWVTKDQEIVDYIIGTLSHKDMLLPNYLAEYDVINSKTNIFDDCDEHRFQKVLRYFSLEVWLQQLINGKHLDPKALKRSRKQSKQPKVSVIIPAHNAEDYIIDCLNSVTSQSLEDIEVIAVDDGSEDSTKRIIEKYCDYDPRIKLISTVNKGVYAARNMALTRARGEYISFVDSDDYIGLDMISEMYKTAIESQADVVFCDVYTFSGLINLNERTNTHHYDPMIPFSINDYPQIIQDGFTTLWNRIYKRSFLDQYSIVFEERYKFSADMLYLQEVIFNAAKIVRIPIALYFHRQHDSVERLTSNTTRSQSYATIVEISKNLVEFWVDKSQFYEYSNYILTKVVRNILWNSRIEISKLNIVLEMLNQYFMKFELSRIKYDLMPQRDREMFLALYRNDKKKCLRIIRTYRNGRGFVDIPVRKLKNKISLAKKRFVNAIEHMYRIEKNNGSISLCMPNIRVCYEYNKHLQNNPILRIARKTVRGLEIGNRFKVYEDIREALSHTKKEAKIRVLHFSNVFSAPSETFTYDVVTGIETNSDIDNHMMFFRRELKEERPFTKTIQLYGKYLGDLEKDDANLEKMLKMVLSMLKPDIIHCHFGWVGVPLIQYLQKLNTCIPVIITMHGTDVNLWPNRHVWYRDFLKANNNYDWIHYTTHTNTYKRKLEVLGIHSSKINVISNSISPKFEIIAGKRKKDRKYFKVISVARMDIWKGQEYLLRGFKIFQQNCCPKSRLTFVGYGKMEDSLRKLAKEIGISRRVDFLGRIAHNKIPTMLYKHDAYVQPSITHEETCQEEGQPIALLEAIVTGIPVVVTDTGGMKETVCSGPYKNNAYVVEQKSDTSIANALNKIYLNKEKRDRSCAQSYVKHILEKHQQKVQVSKTIDLYFDMKRK